MIRDRVKTWAADSVLMSFVADLNQTHVIDTIAKTIPGYPWPRLWSGLPMAARVSLEYIIRTNDAWGKQCTVLYAIVFDEDALFLPLHRKPLT